jgi:hypothetical protein
MYITQAFRYSSHRQSSVVVCSSKELWNLVHDDELIASEREKAAANRKKYGGFDQNSSLFQSMPSGSSPATFSTEPAHRNGDANVSSNSSVPTADAMAATEDRLAKLGLAGDDAAATATGGRVPPPKQAKQRPKLSQISVHSCI